MLRFKLKPSHYCRFYNQTLKLYPKHASIHFKYAGFLRHIRQDVDGAERHYKLSVEHNPKYADGVGGYASFLHGTGGDKVLAEQLYEMSIQVRHIFVNMGPYFPRQLDCTHVNNMCNYGLFLSEEMKNFTRAEEIYTKALDMFPNHANTLYNYAVMLDSHCGRKEEAERFYRRCIEVEPRHSFALYNLAVLREEVLNRLQRPAGESGNSLLIERGDPLWDNTAGEVLSLYQRALEADPRDATTMADCGRCETQYLCSSYIFCMTYFAMSDFLQINCVTQMPASPFFEVLSSWTINVMWRHFILELSNQSETCCFSI